MPDPTAPPYSLEAEQSILGSVLLYEDTWDEVGGVLRESDFFDPKHQRLWSAFGEAVRTHGRADGITVLEALRKDKKLSAFRDYLAHLSSKGVSPAHARATADIVRDWSLRRRLLKGAQKLQAFVLQGDGYRTAAEELLDDILRSERSSDLPPGLVDFWNIQDDGRGWLVENFIKKQQRMFFFGYASIGKSMLLLQAAIQAWAGLPVLGRWNSGGRVKVLYVDLEMGQSSVASRRHTFEISARKAVSGDFEPFPYWLCSDGLDLARHESKSQLEAVVAHVKPELIVIDPFYKVIGGDMYSPKELRPATEFLDFLRVHYGCSMWFGHHNRKPENNGQTPTLSDVFGGSMLQWWPEFVFVVDRDRLVVRKSRESWLEEGQEIPLVKGGDWYVTASSGKVLQSSQRDVLDFLMECGPSGRKQLAAGTDLPAPEIGRILSSLQDVGLVQKVRNPRGGHPVYEAVVA